METVKIAYGKNHISALLPKSKIQCSCTATLPPAAEDPVREVNRALDDPIDSIKLEELACNKKSAVIIASDHTRPVPSKILIPALLARLRKTSPSINISILIATGCHRAPTYEELVDKFSKEIVDNEKIIIHDCDDKENLQETAVLPSGGRLFLNKHIMETDLLIAEGFIEPHFFAGFSGGRKSVLPGCAGRESVLANHCSEFIQSGYARTGILENNPIHEDMLYAAKQAKLAFILNVVINEKKEIVKAFAGDMQTAHQTGCDFLKKHCQIQAVESDAVITGNGGYPLDQNIYQCVKGMTAAEAVCRPGGVIILCAECADGHGGEEFFRVMSNDGSAGELLKKINRIPRNETTPDQWQYQILCRILEKFSVIMVTSAPSRPLVDKMKMQSAASLEEALLKAEKILGKEFKTAVIPDGVSVIARKI